MLRVVAQQCCIRLHGALLLSVLCLQKLHKAACMWQHSLSYPDNFLITLTKSCLSLTNTEKYLKWEKCEIVNFSWLLFSTLMIGRNLLIQKILYIKMEFKYILFHRLHFIPMWGKSIVPKQKKLLSVSFWYSKERRLDTGSI